MDEEKGKHPSAWIPQLFQNRNDSSKCGDCSSYTFGLPFKTCLRVCCAVGIVSSILYIVTGSLLINHVTLDRRVTFSTEAQSYILLTDKYPHYKRNTNFFIGVAVILITINSIQLISDSLLFYSTTKDSKSKSLWLFFMLDILLWIFTLICFVTIFAAGGLLLLFVFLLGTGVRSYIIFILHEFMVEESKIYEKSVSTRAQSSRMSSGRPSSVKSIPKNQSGVSGMEIIKEKETMQSDRTNEVVAFTDLEQPQIETISASTFDLRRNLSEKTQSKEDASSNNNLRRFLESNKLSTEGGLPPMQSGNNNPLPGSTSTVTNPRTP